MTIELQTGDHLMVNVYRTPPTLGMRRYTAVVYPRPNPFLTRPKAEVASADRNPVYSGPATVKGLLPDEQTWLVSFPGALGSEPNEAVLYEPPKPED